MIHSFSCWSKLGSKLECSPFFLSLLHLSLSLSGTEVNEREREKRMAIRLLIWKSRIIGSGEHEMGCSPSSSDPLSLSLLSTWKKTWEKEKERRNKRKNERINHHLLQLIMGSREGCSLTHLLTLEREEDSHSSSLSFSLSLSLSPFSHSLLISFFLLSIRESLLFLSHSSSHHIDHFLSPRKKVNGWEEKRQRERERERESEWVDEEERMRMKMMEMEGVYIEKKSIQMSSKEAIHSLSLPLSLFFLFKCYLMTTLSFSLWILMDVQMSDHWNEVQILLDWPEREREREYQERGREGRESELVVFLPSITSLDAMIWSRFTDFFPFFLSFSVYSFSLFSLVSLDTTHRHTLIANWPSKWTQCWPLVFRRFFLLLRKSLFSYTLLLLKHSLVPSLSLFLFTSLSLPLFLSLSLTFFPSQFFWWWRSLGREEEREEKRER